MPDSELDGILKQNFQHAAFISALGQKFAGSDEQIWLGDSQFTRDEILAGIIRLAQERFPEVFTPAYFGPTFSETKFFNELAGSLSLAAEQTSVSNVPIEKLKEWQLLLAKEGWGDHQLTDTQTSVFEKLELDRQIKLIQGFQEKIKRSAKDLLPKYLEPEQKQRLLDKISEHVVREAVNAPEDVNEESCWNSLQNLRQQDQEVDTFLPKRAQETLTQQLVTAFQETPATTLANAQESIIKSRKILAQPRPMLRSLISSQLGFSPEESEDLLGRLEAHWPKNPNPTPQEVQEAVEKSLTVRNQIALKRNKLSVQEASTRISPHVANYYLAAPLAQKEHNILFTGVSRLALRWAKKVHLDPVILENLLRGARVENLTEALEALGKVNPGYQAYLSQQLKTLDIKQLPTALQLHITKAQFKASVQGLWEKTNPFGFKFYEHHFPKEAKIITTKIQSLEAKKKYMIEKTPAGWVFTPGRKLYRWRTKVTNNIKLSVMRNYAKGVNKVTRNKRVRRFLRRLPITYKPSYWVKQGRVWVSRKIAGLVGKSLMKLGAKLGEKAIGVLLKKAGAYLTKEGFKKLLSKGVAYGLAALFGVSTGGAGLIVGFALLAFDAVKFVFSRRGIEFIKKLLKKIGEIISGIFLFIIKLVGTLPLVLGSIGSAIGLFIAGPAGAAIGAGVGFSVGLFFNAYVAPFFQSLGFGGGIAARGGAGLGLASTAQTAGQAVLSAGAQAGAGVAGAASAIGAAGAAAAAGIGGLLSSLGPALAAIGAPVAVIAFSIVNIASTSAGYIVPPSPEPEPWANPAESDNIMIEKVADKTSFTNEEVASPQTITYTVTITPKTEKPLTNVQIEDKHFHRA